MGVPTDKAVKRWMVKNIVDQSGQRDLKEASVFKEEDQQPGSFFQSPKYYYKAYYSISAACHNRIVRARSRVDRRVRELPPRPQRKSNNDQNKSGGNSSNAKPK